MKKGKLRDITDHGITQYGILGLGITIVGVLASLVVNFVSVLISIQQSTNSNLIIILFAAGFFIGTLILTGMFARPTLAFFGYKVVRK